MGTWVWPRKRLLLSGLLKQDMEFAVDTPGSAYSCAGNVRARWGHAVFNGKPALLISVSALLCLQGGGYWVQGGGWPWQRYRIPVGSELPEHQVKSYVECSAFGRSLVSAGCLLGSWESGHGKQNFYKEVPLTQSLGLYCVIHYQVKSIRTPDHCSQYGIAEFQNY